MPCHPRRGASDEPSTLIRRQAPLALEAVRALGIRLWPMVRFQADDGLATGARALRDNDAVDQVVLCTTDTDLFQCIRGSKVVVLDRIRSATTDEATFRSRYGIAPWQLPDYLALVGAPAKGLPGVPGWGPKTAATMLSHYDSVDQLPTDADDWPSLPRRTQLAAS